MLEGKKTYITTVVAGAGAFIAFAEQWISWQQLVSVLLFVFTFTALRISQASIKKILKENKSVLQLVFKKLNSLERRNK